MANGKFGGGDGSVAKPFLVEDAADLDAIRTKPTFQFKMTKNIELGTAPYNEGTGWNPIQNFSGVLDGNGFVIKNLTITNTDASCAGLFSELIAKAVIQNVGIVRCNIVAKEKAGAIAGRILGTPVNIKQCYSNGQISAASRLGGLIGEIFTRDDVVIEDCHSNVSMNVTNDYCGGLVGIMTADKKSNTLRNGYFNGEIHGGNLITAQPICGKSSGLVCSGLYYNADKNKQACTDAAAAGLTASEMTDKQKFPALLYQYAGAVSRWRFLKNNTPKLWFEDNEKILFFFDSSYQKFDTSSNAWAKVSLSNPPTAEEIAQGMDTIDNIPIAKIRELEAFGKVEVYCFINDLDSGAEAAREVQLLFDVECSKKSIKITSMEEKKYTRGASSTAIIEKLTQKSNDTMSTEIMSESEKIASEKRFIDSSVDKKVSNTKKSKELAITKFDKQKSARTLDDVYRGAFKGTDRQLGIFGIGEKSYTNLNTTIVSEKDGAFEAGLKMKEIMVKKDTKEERKINPGEISYAFTTATLPRKRALKAKTRNISKSRYLFSVNNGSKWLTYNKTLKTWEEAAISSIKDTGLTIEAINDPEIWKTFPTDYKSRVKYAIGISTAAIDITYKVKGLTVEFEPNIGPAISQDSVTVQDDKVTVSGKLFDPENDEIEYQIQTKWFGDSEWKQITPEPSGWFKRKNGYTFTHDYELSKFHAGDNTIRIISRDSRGTTVQKDYQVILVTGEPTVKINSQNEFYMNASIGHTLNKRTRFKILINGKQISPKTGYTEWKDGVTTFDYGWNSGDLQNGLPNKITICAADELGTEVSESFVVNGGYKSLLFRDENDAYYSTDKGDILQQLNFGTIIGGQSSEPHIVYLENHTGLDLENVNVFIDPKQQTPDIKLRLSSVETPFESLEKIIYSGSMKHGESKAFYAKIESNVGIESVEDKIFNIYAKGDPIVS